MSGCDPIINGVPGGLGLPAFTGQWYWEDQFFLNAAVAAAQTPGWATVSTAGYVGSVPAPAAGDTVTRGQARWTLTPDAVAARAGWRRSQATNALAQDGYAAQPETWVWSRWQMNSAVPNPGAGNNYYTSPFGIAAENAGPIEPINGMGLVFDPTLGTPQWVWRAWRAGVPIQLPLGLTWDNNFHTVLAKHRGANGVEVFVGDPYAGVPLISAGILVGAGVQPAATCVAYYGHLMQVDATLAFNPIVTTDIWGWGSPGF